MTTSPQHIYIGLMSGTSMDAVDAVLADFSHAEPHIIAAHSTQLPTSIREKILALCTPGDNEIARMGVLDNMLGDIFADTALQVMAHAKLSADQIIAIGSHGQTIRHAPLAPDKFTLQIANPNIIAQRTRVTTVADFRRRDIAAGGQGAPLVPAFHAEIWRNAHESRAVINIGGMANITLLPCNGDVTGFDCGPGNVLMDGWVQQHLQQPYDQDGSWAHSGTVLPALLDALLAEPFLILTPPKSTGRENFNAEWLAEKLQHNHTENTADVQATLLEFTCRAIALHLAQYAPCTDRVIVCGGGARNKQLLQRLSALLQIPVETSMQHGIDPQHVEALAFAWLAKRTLAGESGNLPAVTGAGTPVICGGIYLADGQTLHTKR